MLFHNSLAFNNIYTIVYYFYPISHYLRAGCCFTTGMLTESGVTYDPGISELANKEGLQFIEYFETQHIEAMKLQL